MSPEPRFIAATPSAMSDCSINFVIWSRMVSSRKDTQGAKQERAYLSDGNCLALVSEREAPQLSVVAELLHADETRRFY